MRLFQRVKCTLVKIQRNLCAWQTFVWRKKWNKKKTLKNTYDYFVNKKVPNYNEQTNARKTTTTKNNEITSIIFYRFQNFRHYGSLLSQLFQRSDDSLRFYSFLTPRLAARIACTFSKSQAEHVSVDQFLFSSTIFR
jgi:hypothetical protein